MADRIGELWFQSLVGSIPGPRQTLKPMTWPGENGVAYKKMGKRSRESQLTGFSVVRTLNAAKAIQEQMEEMVSTLQTIVRQGLPYESRLILDVQVSREFQVTGQVNSFSRYVDGAIIGSPASSVEIRSIWIVRFGAV